MGSTEISETELNIMIALIITLFATSSWIDILSALRFNWASLDNTPFAKLPQFFKYSVGEDYAGGTQPMWQQTSAVIAAFMITPCFIAILAEMGKLKQDIRENKIFKNENTKVIRTVGITAASFILILEIQQFAEFSKFLTKPASLAGVIRGSAGYLGGFLHSFIALYVLYILSNKAISLGILLVIGLAILFIPFIIVQLLNKPISI